MTESPTHTLKRRGVSLWLDDLSRDRIGGGGLQSLINGLDVTGVTTNPTIFAAALASSKGYDGEIERLAADGTSSSDAALHLMTGDVAAAADIFRPTYLATEGADGWVSIEVAADVAQDAAATLEEARRLHRSVGRPNVFVKIPATRPGLAAITRAIADGISVNVTLIFGLRRYEQVVDAYLAGLEQADERGLDLQAIRSVASFFVSRVDSEVDARLAALGSVADAELLGAVGIANSRLALDTFDERFRSERAGRLLKRGAHPQRLLWASTGVKDARMRDTRYVDSLATAGAIITMPEATLRAVADHGKPGDLRDLSVDSARAVIDRLGELGISYDEVVEGLEQRGLEQFERSGSQLLRTVEVALAKARSAA
ncbi:MAG TPA: transaldolase [Amnibacterium sp.]|jgi:transaldolase|nr:transaldolase [Amnibacterium sp.]